MANVNSTTVTNLEATPAVVADAATLYGKNRTLVETVEIAVATADDDTFTLFPVSLDARIDDLEHVNDAITAGDDYDFGFYVITDGTLGAVINADALADNVDISSAVGIWTSTLFFGTGAMDQSACKTKVWQICGYASIEAARDATENNMVYLVVTANTAGSAAGTLSVKLTITVE